MKRRIITLFVGVIHHKNDDEDFADVRFITTEEFDAKQELIQIKEHGIKYLRMKCISETENYIMLKSNDEKQMLESFYVERALIIKGETK